MDTVYLDSNPDDALQNAARSAFGYHGKKFSARPMGEGPFQMSDRYWDGGSKSSYALVRLSDFQLVSIPDFHPFFDKGKGLDNTEYIDTQPGYVVIQHSIFCGKDMGITFHIHPENWKSFALPESPTLSEAEDKTLSIIRSYKSSYRLEYVQKVKLSLEEYEAAKESLKLKGLLDKRGALTTNGHNVAKRFDYNWMYS